MSRGFITLAENSVIDNTPIDYLRLAYGLALSVKATQTEISNISVVVANDTKIPDKYKQVFDEIIPIPWADSSGIGPKFHHEPLAYSFSPYDETVKLEADMLLVKDLQHVWNEYLSLRDFWFTSKVYTYRNEKIPLGYRKDFISNNLPNVYNGMMFFRKGDFATEFFKMSVFIIEHWKEISEQLLDHTRPLYLSTDVVYAMATKFLDINDIVIDDDFDFGFVHMKNELMGWDRKYGWNKWYDNVQYFISDDLEIKVGHFKQIFPFHYHHKFFLTDTIIKKYERYLGI